MLFGDCISASRLATYIARVDRRETWQYTNNQNCGCIMTHRILASDGIRIAAWNESFVLNLSVSLQTNTVCNDSSKMSSTDDFCKWVCSSGDRDLRFHSAFSLVHKFFFSASTIISTFAWKFHLSQIWESYNGIDKLGKKMCSDFICRMNKGGLCHTSNEKDKEIAMKMESFMVCLVSISVWPTCESTYSHV